MNKKTITKGLVAALAATTFIGGFAAATDASAQSRRGWNRGGYGHGNYSRGYYGHNRGWSSGRSLALGAAIGAAVAGGAYYGGYGRGYYGRGYYGPGYGYYGAPGYYGYGYGAATCTRRVWDPYIGRWVRVRDWC